MLIFSNSNGQITTFAKVCLKNVIFIADFAMVDCGENCICKIENDVIDTASITNKTDSDYLNFSQEDDGVMKLQYKQVSKDICGRPNTWVTTEKGETRDFYRILNLEQNE